MAKTKKTKVKETLQLEAVIGDDPPGSTSTTGTQAVEADDEVTPEMKELFKSYDVPPDEFIERKDEQEEKQFEERRRLVYARSIESSVGYSSLCRALSHAYVEQVSYYRSEAGGALPLEEARARAYSPCENDEEATKLFDYMMSIPIDWVSFDQLLRLRAYAPRTSENVWEMIKREARNEVESGHLASKAMTPVQHMRDAWTVGCYLGLRESLAAEWQPRGGIEMNLIDMMAQAFLQFQYWTEQTITRSQTEPRLEAYEYTEWKRYRRESTPKGWARGHWDIPYVSEQDALEHAAQMADRWNRIYMRTLRNLRDLRRYSVPVTINNPQQVNIATDGGQQVNVKADGHKQNEKDY
jgi:hypothetical protein